MSVIAVGNQIDCTHRPSKCLYSHIQQTSARVPKCYQSTERGNTRDITRWIRRIVASEAIPVLTIRVGPCSLGHVVSDVNHTRVSRVDVPAGIYI